MIYTPIKKQCLHCGMMIAYWVIDCPYCDHWWADKRERGMKVVFIEINRMRLFNHGTGMDYEFYYLVGDARIPRDSTVIIRLEKSDPTLDNLPYDIALGPIDDYYSNTISLVGYLRQHGWDWKYEKSHLVLRRIENDG